MSIADRAAVQAGWRSFAAGAAVGLLGGLIGLGGAEFRLPLLLMFGLAVLPAVIVNKAISLVVVTSALVFRGGAVPPTEVAAQWPVVVNLLAGSLASNAFWPLPVDRHGPFRGASPR
jgi:uncharacterized membrane protein YfcA